MRPNPWGMPLLILVLSLSGLTSLVASLREVPAWLGWSQTLVLLLALALELAKVDLFTYHGTERGAVSAGLAATLLVLALYGTQAAVIVALLQAVVTIVVNRTVWFKALFNAGLFTTAAFLAGLVYEHLGGRTPGWELSPVLASLAAASLYFFVQSACVTLAISLSLRRSFRRVWSDNFGWMVLQQAITGMVGLLLGRFMAMGMTFIGVLLLGSPLLILRQSYKIFAARTQAHVAQIEQANSDLAHLNTELRTANDELIQTLGSILDARDRYTYGHSAQVSRYAVALAQKLALGPAQVERTRLAALLHDIGKVGIPEAVLSKAGGLDEYERRIMQAHSEIGYRIISGVHSLAPIADIVRQHHEWFGGGGYPFGLRGIQILLEARIIAVADALDTITSDRPYRKGRPVEVAFSEIRRCAGTQFDPDIVLALEHLMRERGGLWFEDTGARGGKDTVAVEVAASLSGGAVPIPS